MVKVQLSGLKYEYIHFATVYNSKVQFGKQLPPLMLTFIFSTDFLKKKSSKNAKWGPTVVQTDKHTYMKV